MTAPVDRHRFTRVPHEQSRGYTIGTGNVLRYLFDMSEPGEIGIESLQAIALYPTTVFAPTGAKEFAPLHALQGYRMQL